MPKQLLVYENAVPITQSRHGNWSVEVAGDFSFSRAVNSVPLMAVEFGNATPEYPVVFGGTGDIVMPAVILGLRAEENLFVGDDGKWQGKYVPAFLRRYPFIFSSRDDGKTFTLCIDEAFPGFNQDGRGKPLFAEAGKPSEYVNGVLKFLQQYQAEFTRTKQFCEKLKDHNLLEPMQAQVKLASGEQRVLTGFSAVSRGRLKTLSSETLAEMARSDELELIYSHIHSLRNFEVMRDRAPESAQTDGEAADAIEGVDAAASVKKKAKTAKKH